MTEHAQRQFHAAALELHKLVEAQCGSLPPMMREAMELTACLYLAEWAASVPTPEREPAARAAAKEGAP